jgi:hypothetical protein
MTGGSASKGQAMIAGRRHMEIVGIAHIVG